MSIETIRNNRFLASLSFSVSKRPNFRPISNIAAHSQFDERNQHSNKTMHTALVPVEICIQYWYKLNALHNNTSFASRKYHVFWRVRLPASRAKGTGTYRSVPFFVRYKEDSLCEVYDPLIRLRHLLPEGEGKIIVQDV